MSILILSVYFSTKVECAAQCLQATSCDAFTYDGHSCQLLDPTNFYRDKSGSTTTSIYIADSAWDKKGEGKTPKLRHRNLLVYQTASTNDLEFGTVFLPFYHSQQLASIL